MPFCIRTWGKNRTLLPAPSLPLRRGGGEAPLLVDRSAGAKPQTRAMTNETLQAVIEAAWDKRDAVGAATGGEVRSAVETALDRLDKGTARVAEKTGGEWVVNQWLKKAVLLSFRLYDMSPIEGAPGGATWWDKVPSKLAGMTPEAFRT